MTRKSAIGFIVLVALFLAAGLSWIFRPMRQPPDVKPSLALEEHPLQRAPFPRVRDWKSVKITLERNPCYGDCPSYRVEAHGDGSVFYEGKSYVALRGRHRGRVPRNNVLELVSVFEQADYHSLPDDFSPCLLDSSTEVTSIEIDGRRKQVFSCGDGQKGTPVTVSELELAIDRLSDSARWTRGNAATLAALEDEHWDSKSASAAAILARMAEYGDGDAVSALVSKGAPIGGRNDRGNTPLAQAALRGDAAMLRPLLRAGAATNQRDLAYAVVSAAQSGNVEALRLLLRGGRCLDWRDQDGRTALMASATSGSPAMVREILKSRADVNAKLSCRHCDRAGRTALMEVAAHDFWTAPSEDVLEVARLLIHSGAEVNARDKHGNTALILCVQHNHQLALPLIQAGANVNTRNHEGATALSSAYDDDLKRLLTEHGAAP